METDILLESGTNELELLEFTVGSNHYGINVAKIREIITYRDVTPIPNSHPSVEGIVMPRDEIITVINLSKVLNIKSDSDAKNDMLIITNFNKLNIAFHVDIVHGIHRISWADIIKPDATINSSDSSVATGIVKVQGKLIIILDFEKIVSDISPETGLKVSDIDLLGVRERRDIPILMAEDSPLLGKMIFDSLLKAGYTNVTRTDHGLAAWEKLKEIEKEDKPHKKIKCVITDIEMPIMDGHRLLKLIKTDPDTAKIPVVIFSSLINEEMRKKGEMLGADAQLTKPEIGKLVVTIDGLLGNVQEKMIEG